MSNPTKNIVFLTELTVINKLTLDVSYLKKKRKIYFLIRQLIKVKSYLRGHHMTVTETATVSN